MSHSRADGAMATSSRDTATHTSLTRPAAIEQTASEEPAILALPPELQKTIVEHLTSYRDMKSACLICKQLNVIATPCLYRKMEITAEYLCSDAFTSTITSTHPGLSKLKTVRIVGPYSEPSRIDQAASLLLTTIPRNSLTRFELPASISPLESPEILNCVRVRQRNVDNHQYDSVHRNGSWAAFAADTKYLASLRYLRLRVWDSQDNEQASTVLASMHKLTSLDVSLHTFHAGCNCRLLELVLNFRAPRIDHGRPWIQSLRLSGVNFACDSFPRLPGAQGLKDLQLIDRLNYGGFLQMLSALSLNLATFTIGARNALGNRTSDFNNDANEFIRSLHRLLHLSLTLDSIFTQPSTVLDWSTLHGHASAIKSLKVQYYSLSVPYPSDENVSDFRRFCQNASSLEQLSMSGITIPMDKTSGDKHTHGSLEQFLDCVQTASGLNVLELTVSLDFDLSVLKGDAETWDIPHPAQDMIQRRELLVKTSADKIFSTLASHCPRLKVVVIETTWGHISDNFAVRAFLKSEQTDLYGQITAVEPHMVKHYQPCSDILEPDRFVFA